MGVTHHFLKTKPFSFFCIVPETAFVFDLRSPVVATVHAHLSGMLASTSLWWEGIPDLALLLYSSLRSCQELQIQIRCLCVVFSSVFWVTYSMGQEWSRKRHQRGLGAESQQGVGGLDEEVHHNGMSVCENGVCSSYTFFCPMLRGGTFAVATCGWNQPWEIILLEDQNFSTKVCKEASSMEQSN